MIELEQQFRDLAARVAAGETVVVMQDGEPLLDLVPHRPVGGFDRAALDAFKKANGLGQVFAWDPATFDEPLPDEAWPGLVDHER